MTFRVFSESAFAAVVRAGDSRRFGIDLKEDRADIIRGALEFANDASARFPNHHITTVRGKRCVSYSEYSTHLVLRSIARHLQRRLRIALPNRDRAVRGVIESLLDSTPMHILRRDIASFYETIPLTRMRDHLLYDTASSAQVRGFLRAFFDQHCGSATSGLPRGVGLSAVLAEYALQDFDQNARKIEGVYKYFRFADDIIIFSYLPPADISDRLDALLPKPMQFNSRKSLDLSLQCFSRKSAADVSFDYLGYRFVINSYCGEKASRNVVVTISPKKIDRLKTRIILSLRDYKRRGDFGLLKSRIRFLSSNYYIRRSGITKTKGSSHIKSGIYYNYSLCGRYSFNKHTHQFLESDGRELKALDGFLNSLIKSRASAFSANLSDIQRGELRRYSFYQGFRLRMTARYKAEDVHRIKSVWTRHV